MDAQNKVSVRIYGQEYTIAGSSPPDQITKVANFVDDKMHKIAAAIPSCSVSNLAVLTAVNLTDEYFRLKKTVEELSKIEGKHEKEVQRYVKLLEAANEDINKHKDKARKAFEKSETFKRQLEDKELKYESLKAENQKLKDANDELNKKNEYLMQSLDEQEELEEADNKELDELRKKCKEMDEVCKALKEKNEKLIERLGAQEEYSESSHHEIKVLEERCKEMETAFFDMQMENIQLKGELDRYKKIVE